MDKIYKHGRVFGQVSIPRGVEATPGGRVMYGVAGTHGSIAGKGVYGAHPGAGDAYRMYGGQIAGQRQYGVTPGTANIGAKAGDEKFVPGNVCPPGWKKIGTHSTWNSSLCQFRGLKARPLPAVTAKNRPQPKRVYGSTPGTNIPLTQRALNAVGFFAPRGGQFGQRTPRTIRGMIRQRSDADARPSPMNRLVAQAVAPRPSVPALPADAPYDMCVEYPSGVMRFKNPGHPDHGKHPLDAGYTVFDWVEAGEDSLGAYVAYGQEFDAVFPVCQELSGPQMLRPAPLSPRPTPTPTQPRPTYVQPGPLRPGGGGGTPGDRPGGTPTTPTPGDRPGDRPGERPGDRPTPGDVFGECCVEMLSDSTGILICENPMYDGMVVNTDGTLDGEGQILVHNPGKTWRAFLPICEPTIEIVPDPGEETPDIPPDCCYDASTGKLFCPGSVWHGLDVMVAEDFVMATGQRVVIVFTEDMAWRAQLPVCITEETPDPGDEPVRPRPTPHDRGTECLPCGELPMACRVYGEVNFTQLPGAGPVVPGCQVCD